MIICVKPDWPWPKVRLGILKSISGCLWRKLYILINRLGAD